MSQASLERPAHRHTFAANEGGSLFLIGLREVGPGVQDLDMSIGIDIEGDYILWD